MIEIGRVCTKIAGREAGNKCIIVDVIDKNYVVVSGPKVKRRRCNIKHLEFHPEVKKIDKDISDEQIKRLLS
ncbi:MAG: 50S ribosomal protein L14e [Methanomicrobia archaeon]|nr:50S ribosomal protein L14e [Methanomicrobia archaeon]HDM22502.1 50S ribosomal protein L14e [Methanomicrobia archaeon]